MRKQETQEVVWSDEVVSPLILARARASGIYYLMEERLCGAPRRINPETGQIELIQHEPKK